MIDRLVSIRTTSFASQAAAAALVAVLSLSIGCGQQTAAGKGAAKGKTLDPVKVQTVDAKPASVRPTIRVTGTLYAMEDVVVSAKVAGRVVAIKHDLGDRVGPDQPLADIDRIDYELAVTERQMAVSATLAKLGLTAFPSTELKADEVPTVKGAALQLSNVRAKYERLKKLFEETPPLISEQEYADARTLYQVAQSTYDVALLNARALLAEAQTRQAELGVANQRLSDASVRTPVPTAATADQKEANPTLQYAVAGRLVSVGEYVREGTPLFRLIDDDPVKLRALVPERYAGQVNKGLSVAVRVQAHAAVFTGTVYRVSPQVDPASRTFTVEVLIVNPKGLLKPGAFANADIVLPTERPAASVPPSAVTSFAGVHKVFTIKDGKAVEQRVELGDRDAKSVVIISGLNPGERIVLAPPAQMVGGTPVILPPAGAE